MREDDLRYTKTHEWVMLKGQSVVVGITDYAQEQLGDIVGVEFPEPGKEVEKGEAVAVIESVKSASDVYAPLSGIITQINEELEDAPELINEEPYKKGWIFKLKISNEEELTELMDYDEYQSFIEEEEQ